MTDRTKVMLVEIACVLAILASIAVIVVPKLDDLKRRDAAAVVQEDLDGLREAVFAFYSDSAYFPEESPTGPIPDGLRVYLPRGFVSQRSYGAIVYRNWPGDPPPVPVTDSAGVAVTAAPAAANADAERVTASNVVGAMIIASDAKVVATAAARTPLTARFVVGNRFTFLFFGS